MYTYSSMHLQQCTLQLQKSIAIYWCWVLFRILHVAHSLETSWTKLTMQFVNYSPTYYFEYAHFKRILSNTPKTMHSQNQHYIICETNNTRAVLNDKCFEYEFCANRFTNSHWLFPSLVSRQYLSVDVSPWKSISNVNNFRQCLRRWWTATLATSKHETCI